MSAKIGKRQRAKKSKLIMGSAVSNTNTQVKDNRPKWAILPDNKARNPTKNGATS